MAKIFTITEGLENMGALKTGGQGSVYKAKRTGTIITAVKILPTPIHSESANDKHYTDFQNEVQKLKKVNEQPNPNVVKILNFGITDSGALPFIEMEFIEGPDMEELLKPPHDPIFTIKETIKVAEQLSNALAHCHKQDVKHGDVKSNNVKFNIHSGNYLLLDFGLAIMSDEQRRTSLRHAGAIEFMAPEQSEGKMLFQSDVYSFGVILFELLAGIVPFPLKGNGESDRNHVMIAHMENPVPDLLSLRMQNLPTTWSEEKKENEMQVPEWLTRMIYKCLQKNSENRFANGMQLQEYIALNSILASNKKEWSEQQLQTLQQVNKKLLEEKEQLQKSLLVYQQKKVEEVQRPFGKKKSSSGIIALLATLIVAALVTYFIVKTKIAGNTPPDNPTPKTNTAKQIIGQYKVIAERAYFYNEPNDSTRRSAYLIPSNDVIAALDEKNGFVKVEFTNNHGQTSKGWVHKQDLVTLDEWVRNNKAKEQARLNQQDINNQLKNAQNLLDNNQVKEALYIYSYLSQQQVPEAMFQYANLALQNKNEDISCDEALTLINKAAAKNYIPAKRTLGFLYLFAENNEVLQVSNYDRCTYEKNALKGTQLLTEAAAKGDTTAQRILDDIKIKGEEGPVEQQ